MIKQIASLIFTNQSSIFVSLLMQSYSDFLFSKLLTCSSRQDSRTPACYVVKKYRFHLPPLEGTAFRLYRLKNLKNYFCVQKDVQTLTQHTTSGRTSPYKLEAVVSTACNHHNVETYYHLCVSCHTGLSLLCLYSVLSTAARR